MTMLKKFAIINGLVLLSLFTAKAQVTIVNLQLVPYNLTTDAMLSATISNSGSEQQVQLVSKLYNFNNELLLTVTSSAFPLKQGLNTPFVVARKIAGAEFSHNDQAEYIKTTHTLPSGTFKVCVDVILSKSLETADQFCDEIESDFNQYLYLVFPADKDTIETATPLLIWSHSEPFTILAKGEYFRMIVSEIKEKQSPEEAIDINTPLMAKTYLTTHSLQYPYDAKELKEGGHYAWQVQKMANGVVTNKTEAWEFTVRIKPEEKDVKYVSLKKVLDAGYYIAGRNRIYFTFDEEYASSSNIIQCAIYNSKREVIKPKATNEGVKSAPLNYKANGYNRYEINLDALDIKHGFYTLEVKNEKGELFLLTFYVQ